MKTDVKIAAAHGFVRSLNVLLKFARLYDFGHPRTAAQFETAWEELRAALQGAGSGTSLGREREPVACRRCSPGIGGDRTEFCPVALGCGHFQHPFFSQVTKADLARFLRAFPTSGTNPTALAEQLKVALGNHSAIHVNKVSFVPADSGAVHAQAIARNSWFDDPQKLLQLVVAAEGAEGGVGSFGGDGSGEIQRGAGGSGGRGRGCGRDSRFDRAQAKTGTRDARHLLGLPLTDRFPCVWIPTRAERDARQFSRVKEMPPSSRLS